MAKESLYGINYKPRFRETFNSEYDIRRNNHIPYNISLDNGIAIFNGSTSYIKLLNKISFGNDKDWSIRFKGKTEDITQGRILGTENSTNGYLVFYNNDGGSGDVYIRLKTNTGSEITCSIATGSLGITNEIDILFSVSGSTNIVKLYLNGNLINTQTNKTDTATSFDLIGAFDTKTTYSWKGEMDLLEIWDQSFTDQEVKNLYENKRYHDIAPKTTTYTEVIDIDSRCGFLNDKYGKVITNSGIEVVRDGSIYTQKFNGSSFFTTTISIGIGEKFALCVWAKSNNVGIQKIFAVNNSLCNAYLESGKLYYFYNGLLLTGSFVADNNYNFYVFTHDGISMTASVNGVKYIDNTRTSIALSGELKFGQSFNTQYFIGKMNQQKLFKGNLSLEEISQLYTSTKQYFLN